MTVSTHPQPAPPARPGPERTGTLDVHLILLRDTEILLGQRQGTGDDDGRWHLPTARTRLGGDVKHAAARAGRHLLGIGVGPSDLRLGYVLWHHTGTAIFLHTTRWVGAPTNHTPDQYTGWVWFPIADAVDLTAPTIAFALAEYLAGRQYGELPPRDAARLRLDVRRDLHP